MANYRSQRPPRDEVERHTSMVNRINISRELPISTYIRNAAATQGEKEDARIRRAQAGGLKEGMLPMSTGQDWKRWEEQHHYRKHYTDYRGNSTQKRGNLTNPISADPGALPPRGVDPNNGYKDPGQKKED